MARETLTKGEARRARKAARAAGQRDPLASPQAPRRDALHSHKASRAEQYGRYLDCGPQAWDDCDSPSGDY